MGRYSFTDKTEADGLNKINIYWLHKHRFLEPNCQNFNGITWTRSDGTKNNISFTTSTNPGDQYIRLIYTSTHRGTGEKKDLDYKIPLITSFCHFGGVRYWFECNAVKNGRYCGRRVATLYIDGDYFACRHCNNLTYSCKKQNYRGYFSILGKLCNVEKQISELQASIKRYTYAGRPTKKVRRFLKLTKSHPQSIDNLIDSELYRG